MRPERLGRRRGAGEGHRVLAREVVEEAAEAAADELQRAFRQDPRLDDAPHDRLGKVGRRGRRLHDRRHAREERGGQLLEHAPDGEIERIDVDRGTLQRHADVLADERAALRQCLDVAVDEYVAVGELAAALAREHQHRADATIDVDPRIRLGGARLVGERVELILEFGEAFAQRAQPRGTLVKGERPQRRPADAARVLEHGLEIDPGARGMADHRTGRRVLERDARALAIDPASEDIALELHRATPSAAATAVRPRSQSTNVRPLAASSRSIGAAVQSPPWVRSNASMPASTVASPMLPA